MADDFRLPEGVIFTPRLDLVSLSPAFLAASLDGDHRAAEEILGANISEDWFGERVRMARRLKQMQADPGLEEWLSRAIVLRDKPRPFGDPPPDAPAISGDRPIMVGQIGFHSRPGPAYLDEIAQGGVEIGYTVFSPFRRRGFAREACEALMEWAFWMHGVMRFVLSISPHNIPSTQLALSMGFRQAGSQEDEEDGTEIIYVLGRSRSAVIDVTPHETSS